MKLIGISCFSIKIILLSILQIPSIIHVHSQLDYREQPEDWEQPAVLKILPENPLLYIGETLKLQCKISDGSKSSDLYFKFVPFKSNRVWERTDLDTTNETFAWIELNITEEYAPHTNVYCINKETSKSCSTLLYAERPITSVGNITGVYLYETELNVTWDLGEKYYRDEEIGVETVWLNLAIPNKNYSFTCTTSTKESCIIQKSASITLHDIIYFNITVYSANFKKRPTVEYLTPLFSSSSEKIHVFNLKNITKSDPAKSFKFTNISSMCLSVTWMNSTYLENCHYCKHVYQIDIKEETEVESQFQKVVTIFLEKLFN